MVWEIGILLASAPEFIHFLSLSGKLQESQRNKNCNTQLIAFGHFMPFKTSKITFYPAAQSIKVA